MGCRRLRSALVAGRLMGSAVPALAPALAQGSPVWRDGYVARLQALALLQTLNAELLSHDSATLTLDRWCGAHGFAAAKVRAERVPGIDKPAAAQQRRILGVSDDEPVRYRHVRLSCGGRVLSEADNWYLPARLTPQMNRALDTSDIAFGRAVQALHYLRHTLAATLLWRPLPEGWETAPAPGRVDAGPMAMPEHVLEHRAVLVLPDGKPFSEVVETYSSQLLVFPQPRGRALSAAPARPAVEGSGG